MLWVKYMFLETIIVYTKGASSPHLETKEQGIQEPYHTFPVQRLSLRA